MGNEEKWLTEAKSTAKMQAEMFVDELIKIAIEDRFNAEHGTAYEYPWKY